MDGGLMLMTPAANGAAHGAAWYVRLQWYVWLYEKTNTVMRDAETMMRETETMIHEPETVMCDWKLKYEVW